MPLNLVPPQRLTWHPSLPAPFESGSSIFRMILALNHMPMEVLSPMIRKTSGKPIVTKRTILLKSDWIDFERFGRLLGVQPERLQRGFLDQLGFIVNTEFPNSIATFSQSKFCPECERYGYHCVFFDLAIITECPWHRRPLMTHSNRCVWCCSPMKKTFPELNTGVCPKCGGAQAKSLTDQCFNRFDEGQTATILGYCAELAMWRQTVKDSIKDHEALIADIDKRDRSYLSSGPLDFTSWQLSYAIESAKTNIYWKLNFVPVDVCHARYFDKPVVNGSVRTRIRDEYGIQYRSVKRHVFNKFVRRHRLCVDALCRLTRDQSLCVDGEAVCPVALAYVVWRMSIEGIGNVEAFRKARTSDYQLRLMAPADDCSSPFQLTWSYLGFLGLVTQFEQLCGKKKISIDFDVDHRCSGYLVERVRRLTSRESGTQNVFDVLYPCIVSTWASAARCRKKRPANIVNLWCTNSQSEWAWTNRDDQRNAMFRIQMNTASDQKNQYIHLMV